MLRERRTLILQSGFLQIYRKNAHAIREELTAGLLAPHAHTSAKYLYDALGSKLFAAICVLPEYYPTRTETAIFNHYLHEIADAAGTGKTLIDLGAGDCEKAARLFSALRPKSYVPVDISVDFLRDAVEALHCRYPEMAIYGIGMDFSAALDFPETIHRANRLFFYPGSSIGNFAPEQAAGFLAQVRAACHEEGSLLIGVDLVKDTATLEAAYDDAIGLTAAFNLNLLQHLNVLLDANFVPHHWRHRSFFNREESRIEMHLEAQCDTTVIWNGGERCFARGEYIHTENSYKYTREKFLQLLERTGFGHVHSWMDPNKWFMVCHAHAV